MSNNIHIDKNTQEVVPTNTERAVNTLVSIFLGFFLVQLIGFWMFPGMGVGGLYMFSSAHSMVAFIGNFTNIAIITFMAICGVIGWFRGKYFIKRLKDYIEWWRFW